MAEVAAAHPAARSTRCGRPSGIVACWILPVECVECIWYAIYAFNVKRGLRVKRSRKRRIDWQVVGRRLRQLRGFDTYQADFARKLGISQSQLSRYERGESELDAELLLRISEKFGKTIEWLLTGAGDE